MNCKGSVNTGLLAKEFAILNNFKPSNERK